MHHYGYVEKTWNKDLYLEGGERKVQDYPEDLQARYELALAYRECGLFSKALANIEVAIYGMEKVEEETNTYLREELVRLVQAELLSFLGRPEHALGVEGQPLRDVVLEQGSQLSAHRLGG